MKSISASIIVVVGAVLILQGAYVPHSDTRVFVQFVGFIVSGLGLWGWFQTIKEK